VFYVLVAASTSVIGETGIYFTWSRIT